MSRGFRLVVWRGVLPDPPLLSEGPRGLCTAPNTFTTRTRQRTFPTGVQRIDSTLDDVQLFYAPLRLKSFINSITKARLFRYGSTYKNWSFKASCTISSSHEQNQNKKRLKIRFFQSRTPLFLIVRNDGIVTEDRQTFKRGKKNIDPLGPKTQGSIKIRMRIFTPWQYFPYRNNKNTR